MALIELLLRYLDTSDGEAADHPTWRRIRHKVFLYLCQPLLAPARILGRHDPSNQIWYATLPVFSVNDSYFRPSGDPGKMRADLFESFVLPPELLDYFCEFDLARHQWQPSRASALMSQTSTTYSPRFPANRMSNTLSRDLSASSIRALLSFLASVDLPLTRYGNHGSRKNNALGEELNSHVDRLRALGRTIFAPAKSRGNEIELLAHGLFREPLRITPRVAADLALEKLGFKEGLPQFKIDRLLSLSARAGSFVGKPSYVVSGQRVVLRVPRRLNAGGRPGVGPKKFELKEFGSHPGIVPYVAHGVHEGTDFLVRPYVPGKNLGHLFGELSGSKKIGTAAYVLKKVSEALDFLHRQGVRHGRVKEENIISGSSGVVAVDAQVLSTSLSEFPLFEDDIHGLASTMKRLLDADWEKLPGWFVQIVEAGLAVDPTLRPTAEEVVEWIKHFMCPEDGRLITMTATWSAPEDRICYDFDVGGNRNLKTLRGNAGPGLIRDLCALWREIEELEWRDISCEELSNEFKSRFAEVGDFATQEVLGLDLHGSLEDHLPLPLWVVYDPALASIPWELLEVNGERLCRYISMARFPRLGRDAQESQGYRVVASGRELRVLLIADLSGDLPFAQAECRRLKHEFEDSCLADRLEVRVMDGSENLMRILNEVQLSDVVHFAGHAVFSETDPGASALMLRDDERLDARRLLDYWKGGRAPTLFFANACTSAESPKASRTRFMSDAAMGLAQAFLAAGVASYIGSAWVVPDSYPTAEFASHFYRRFLAGYCAGQAMLEARNECADRLGETDLSWARYVLYGHPFNRIDLSSGIPNERDATIDS